MPNNIKAWLRGNGIKWEEVSDASPNDAISILSAMASREWRMARVYPNGLLALHSTSPLDASLAGVLFTHLSSRTPHATAEALSPLVVTLDTSMFVRGILDHPGGCLIEGLGTGQVVFLPLR